MFCIYIVECAIAHVSLYSRRSISHLNIGNVHTGTQRASNASNMVYRNDFRMISCAHSLYNAVFCRQFILSLFCWCCRSLFVCDIPKFLWNNLLAISSTFRRFLLYISYCVWRMPLFSVRQCMKKYGKNAVGTRARTR